MSVNISVETPNENQIHEIAYDGTETYQPKSSLEDLKKEDNKDGVPVDQFQPSLWPWDSVRNKLRDALTEVCVLQDVLSIAKDRKYLILDPIQQEPPESKPMVQVYARKKALAQAASVLINGADRLKASNVEQKNKSNFHIELLRLRQNWRLKKVSNGIIGDLTYRKAGSKFWHNGTFEVTKSEDDPEAEEEAASGPSTPTSTIPPTIKQTSAIKVNVPSELQGVAYIKVITQKDHEDLCTAKINLMGYGRNTAQQSNLWQTVLERAQNVLFCKELFNQLAREAIQLQAPIPHVVIGNEIRASLFPQVQLIISLVHTISTEKSSPNQDNDSPASGPLGPSKKRMLAGPLAADRFELLEMTKSETILEQIIAQAQHAFLRRRTQYVLDTLARDVRDPQIVSHWNAMNSPTMSCVKINIVTHGYETMHRTALLIHVKDRTLKCIGRDGRVMHLSYEPQELRDLILCQVNQHQITSLLSLAKCLAWQVLSNSNHLGIGSVEPLGNASACLLSSPNGDRMIAVELRSYNSLEARVFIAKSPRQDFFQIPLVPEKIWENLGGHFREVRFDKIEGKSFLMKMEYLMASLTSASN
uniref:Mediator of RNA polymerase II transcription subunit 17 n=1 Tax=Megaselia scalaris TaxID=36166 RepID=T1GD12_MEGSC